MAAYYDIPHINMHRLLKESFMETSLNKRLNISKVNYQTSVTKNM